MKTNSQNTKERVRNNRRLPGGPGVVIAFSGAIPKTSFDGRNNNKAAIVTDNGCIDNIFAQIKQKLLERGKLLFGKKNKVGIVLPNKLFFFVGGFKDTPMLDNLFIGKTAALLGEIGCDPKLASDCCIVLSYQQIVEQEKGVPVDNNNIKITCLACYTK